MPEFTISPTVTSPIVNEKGEMRLEMILWVQTINNRTLIIDAGRPEGVISAVIGAEYMDSNGTTSNVKYIKQKADIAGDKTLGWILI